MRHIDHTTITFPWKIVFSLSLSLSLSLSHTHTHTHMNTHAQGKEWTRHLVAQAIHFLLNIC